MGIRSVLVRMSYVAGVSILLCSLAANTALAQTTYSYIQNAGGAQAWTNDANWSGVAPSPIAGDTIQANLSMSASTFLDLGADRTFDVWTSSFGGFAGLQFTINSGYTITLAGTTPTITHNGKGTVIMENVLAGTAGLLKSGSQTLELRNATNSFSGGIVLAGGTLRVASDACFGDAGNSINVSANSTLSLSSGTYDRDIAINDGVTLSHSDKNTVTLSGAVTGLGGMSMRPSGFGSQSLTLSSTSNTFTGPIVAGNDSALTLTVNSLADSTNSMTLLLSNKGDTTFILGTGATAPITLSSRQVVLGGNQTKNHVIQNDNADTNNTITINTDFSVTSTTARKLILQGINTGDNAIAGVIPDGDGSTTTLVKQDAGTWVLSGANTYSGSTTVNGGYLALADSNCLLDSGTLTINGGNVRLDAGVKERIDNLVLGSTPQTTNTSYGSLSSSAKIKSDAYFSGSGLLYLGMDPPPGGAVIFIR